MGIKVEVKPFPQKLSLVCFLFSKLPGFCSYCGKRYVDSYSNKVNLFNPIIPTGKMCPNGHEGYIKENVLCGIIKYQIDNVKKI